MHSRGALPQPKRHVQCRRAHRRSARLPPVSVHHAEPGQRLRSHASLRGAVSARAAVPALQASCHARRRRAAAHSAPQRLLRGSPLK